MPLILSKEPGLFVDLSDSECLGHAGVPERDVHLGVALEGGEDQVGRPDGRPHVVDHGRLGVDVYLLVSPVPSNTWR